MKPARGNGSADLSKAAQARKLAEQGLHEQATGTMPMRPTGCSRRRRNLIPTR